MELKTKIKTLFRVDYNDFDSFVKQIYGGNFDFVIEHNARNYSSYEFSAPNLNIDFGGKYEEKIRSGNFNGVPVNALFNVLFKDGHIEKGDYLIEVSW